MNPAQFDDPEDLADYGADPEADAQAAERAGADILFVPSVEDMYPEGFQTWVEVEEISRGLEGDARPGHFRGVATVCLKLFNIVRPERAYFGEKDAQQVAVVERLVRDLNLELEIRVIPTVRDTDNIALSSRNARLSEEERQAARALPRALFSAQLAHRRGDDAVAAAHATLAEEPLVEPEYVEVARFEARPILAAAVRVGRVRLIDNVRHLEGAVMSSRPPTAGKLPLTELGEMKKRGDPIVMVTAYDYPSGRLVDAAGVDIVLVGDTAAMVVMGYDGTVPATLEEMLLLTRGSPGAPLARWSSETSRSAPTRCPTGRPSKPPSAC